MREKMRGKSSSVDVLIAVWNNAKTIERAVSSALSDPHVSRVIVIDDASTDETPSVLRALQDGSENRLIYLRLDRNVGPAAARNRGIELSTAPWVGILDGDDFFLQNRMDALLDASEGADFVADDQIQILDQDSRDAVASRNFLIGHGSELQVDLSTFIAKNLSQKDRPRKEFGFLKPIMLRSFLDKNALRYDENLRLGEDFILYAKALADGAVFKVVPSRKYVSVTRSNSISGQHSKADLQQLHDSSKKLSRLPTLTDREKKLFSQHYESIDARIQWLNVIEAIKSRNWPGLWRPFFVRWNTSAFLFDRLWEQAVFRSRRAVGLPEKKC